MASVSGVSFDDAVLTTVCLHCFFWHGTKFEPFCGVASWESLSCFYREEDAFVRTLSPFGRGVANPQGAPTVDLMALDIEVDGISPYGFFFDVAVPVSWPCEFH